MKSITARRLLFAFGSIILIIGAAAYAALRGMTEMHDSLHHLKHQNDAERAALELATMIEGRRDLDAAPQRLEEALDSVEESFAELGSREQLSAVSALAAQVRADGAPVGRQGLDAAAAELRRAASALDESQKSFEAHGAAIHHAAFQRTFAALGGAIVFALAVAVYIGRAISRPLRRLRDGAARIASGDLDTRIEVHGADEFGELAGKFNQMVAALKIHQGKLIETEKLAGLGRMAAGIAHEINNPLGVILGFTGLIRRGGSPETAERVQIIEDEVHRCREIVEGLLDLARPLKGPVAHVDLRVVCECVVERLGESRVRIEGAAAVEAQETAIRQVIVNLVKNALDAAGSTGQVVLRLAATHEGVALAVEDDGPGLDAEVARHVFEPFFTTKAEGTGLGLTVAESIARAHGGRIDVSSRAPRGTIFTLHLPSPLGPSA
jgi:signal transduction histidine kinase